MPPSNGFASRCTSRFTLFGYGHTYETGEAPYSVIWIELPRAAAEWYFRERFWGGGTDKGGAWVCSNPEDVGSYDGVHLLDVLSGNNIPRPALVVRRSDIEDSDLMKALLLCHST